ncbi:hypothetical protein BD626DRAFT_539207 [Schizophyllum amplum]|uniref:Uncharacterized protein n=1 Tax=Schizophyllum amplum TaxID=97359 RepID=A0A550C4P5_9AGAR|nr:hypothetical protein BD626DRAFT_539207 [Auriculariopsis ampla]
MASRAGRTGNSRTGDNVLILQDGVNKVLISGDDLTHLCAVLKRELHGVCVVKGARQPRKKGVKGIGGWHVFVLLRRVFVFIATHILIMAFLVCFLHWYNLVKFTTEYSQVKVPYVGRFQTLRNLEMSVRVV